MCSTKSPSSLRGGPWIHGPACARQVASLVITWRLPSAWSMVMWAIIAGTDAGRPWPGVDQCVMTPITLGLPGDELLRDVGRLVVLLVGVRVRRPVRDANTVHAQVVLLPGRHVRAGAHDRARP